MTVDCQHGIDLIRNVAPGDHAPSLLSFSRKLLSFLSMHNQTYEIFSRKDSGPDCNQHRGWFILHSIFGFLVFTLEKKDSGVGETGSDNELVSRSSFVSVYWGLGSSSSIEKTNQSSSYIIQACAR